MGKLWVAFRLVVVAVSATAGLSLSASVAKAPIVLVPVGLVAGFALIAWWVRPLYGRVVSDVSWEAPSWRRSPIDIARPLEFFELFAISLVTLSFGMLIGALLRGVEVHTGMLVPAMFGCGIILATRLKGRRA